MGTAGADQLRHILANLLIGILGEDLSSIFNAGQFDRIRPVKNL